MRRFLFYLASQVFAINLLPTFFIFIQASQVLMKFRPLTLKSKFYLEKYLLLNTTGAHEFVTSKILHTKIFTGPIE